MRSSRRLALGASILASLAIVGTAGGGAIVSAQEKPTIYVGSDNFYEAELAAEIYAQALEARGYPVNRDAIRVGSRAVRLERFEAGDINLMPEYVGFGLQYFTLDPDRGEEVRAIETSGVAETDAVALQEVYDLLGFDATVFGVSSGEDRNAAVIRADTAAELGLSKMSELAAVQDDLRWGLPPECDVNAPCIDALQGVYGITYPPANLSPLPACGAEMALALEGNAIDIAWMCSTQPELFQKDWVVLEDDLLSQPPGNLVPVMSNDLVAGFDGGAEALAAILDPISAALTTDVLVDLNVRIAGDQEEEQDVAAEFLAGLEA